MVGKFFPQRIFRAIGNKDNFSCLSRYFSKTSSVSAERDSLNEDPQVQKEVLEHINVSNIRNFSIIAHVDHGKSTLADRFLELTGLLTPTSSNKQVLDRLQVEKERGITVKAQTVSLLHEYNGQRFLLNLIDTPGHVDFSNEVARSLAACQGVVLLVDANQGVQAQTVANFYLAFTQDLVIIPVLNKVDLKNADPDAVTEQLHNLFDIDAKDVLRISAKMGTGVKDVIEAIIRKIPPPSSNREAPLKALLFDCWYDRYRGVIGLVFIKDGSVRVGDSVKWCQTGKQYTIKTISLLRPTEIPVNVLVAGQVGCISCNMRSISEANMGDTMIHVNSDVKPLSGFSLSKPMVFAGVYPMDQSQHLQLRSAIEKLTLNDNAVTVTIESSPALGQGWRLGFLGFLHLEVFNQRLEQEYGAEAIVTSPSVTYKVIIHGKKNIDKLGGSELYISNPLYFPDPQIIVEIQEPIVLGTIITPDTFVGDVINLCLDRRGVQQSATNIDNTRVMLQFLLPLNEIIVDFHDHIKSLSSGFASFDYEDKGYVASNLIKMDIYLNGKEVPELSSIVYYTKATQAAKRLCKKLVDIIPRQQFLVAIQAKIGGKIIARENLKPYRKDVTAKLYGGDVTRRIKLLKRQAEGKSKLKIVANIALPRETFIEVLKR